MTTTMKAIAVFPGKPDSAHLTTMPRPDVRDVEGGRGDAEGVHVRRKDRRGGAGGGEIDDQAAYALAQAFVVGARSVMSSRRNARSHDFQTSNPAATKRSNATGSDAYWANE